MRNTIEDIDRISKKHSISIEIIVGISAIVFLIYKMRSTLIFGKTTFFHDNIMWNYPIFQFFAESLMDGRFPFWNPFTHGGEPLYTVLAQLRFFEPITLLTIYLGQFISDDIAILFNWNFITKSLMMAFGVYIVFRPLALHLFIRLSLIPILLFSSFMVVSFRQCGLFDQFILIPFVAYFLLRIVYYKDYRWHNWFALAGTIGINWQSYFFTGTWTFLLFFVLGFVIFRRDLLADLFKSKIILAKFAVLIVIIFAMATPSIVLLLEKDRYAFPARMVDADYAGKYLPQGGPQQYEGVSTDVDSSSSGINMPYSFIAFTGTFSTIWDFIQFIAPDGNQHIRWSGRDYWGKPSEAYMYLGFLPWVIAVLGMVAGKHDLKKVWLFVLIGFGLLMLGPAGGLHRFLYHIYPPMWFVRHTHSFVLIFIFAFLYFFVLGFNHIFSSWGGSLFRSEVSQGILNRLIKNDNYRNGVAMIIFSACIISCLYWMAMLEYPVTNYLFVLFIPIFVSGWLLRKDLGERGLYICIIVSHVVIIFIFTSSSQIFFRTILEMFLLPFALFIYIHMMRRKLSESVRYYLTFFMFVSFAFCLVADLTYHFKKSHDLYLGTPHPGLLHNVKTTPQEPLLPQKRSIFPKYSDSIYNDQSARYLSLIYRQPFIFSPIMKMDQHFYDVALDKAIFDEYQKLSFGKWFLLPDGNISPEQFDYRQDGIGGSVERYIYDDGVKDKKISTLAKSLSHGNYTFKYQADQIDKLMSQYVSALLKPSSYGNSTLRYKTDQVDELRGHYIRVLVMAKSENKTPDAIQVDLQDGTENTVLASYENSGIWEYLSLIKYIGEDAERLQLTCSIKSTATADVYFNSITIDVLPYNEFFDYNNINSDESAFEEYKQFLYHNYIVSDKAIFEEYKKFSLEKWCLLPDGSSCPEEFVFQQDRSRGAVIRYISKDGDNKGTVCALLKPSSRGNSTLIYQTDQIDDLRNRYIRVSVMAKSENKAPDAIQVDVQDGIDVPEKEKTKILKSYNNSGAWERLELIKYIGENAEYLRLTSNITSNATADVYFIPVKIDVMSTMEAAPHNKDNNTFEFEGALKSKRWSSFLLPKKYFELIHKDIPSPALVEMFAVDKPVFQIKKGIVQVAEKEIPAFFEQLDITESIKLLQDAVIIVDKKLDPALSILKRSVDEYVSGNQTVSFDDYKKSGIIPDLKEDWKPTYTIEKYTYDTCDLKVSTNNDGILYWSDGYDKGWQAYVNKKEVPVYRANVNFKAISIPKGTSYINFTFNPSLFKAGLIVFYGTILVCILAVLIFISFDNLRRRVSH